MARESKRKIRAGVLALALSFAAGAEAQPANLLAINPNILEFNPTGVGTTSAVASPNIYNLGTTPVTITSFSITGSEAGDFYIDPTGCPVGTPLNPGRSCQLKSVAFTPSAVGARLATLVVKDAGGPPQLIIMTGQALTATQVMTFFFPELVFPSLPIGLPPQDAATGATQAKNSGTAPVTIRTLAITGPNAGDFQIHSGSCIPGPLPAGGSCPIFLSFLPTATGIRSATLVVTDDAGVQTVALTGVGSAPLAVLEVFPIAVDFASIPPSTSESVQLNVENTGSEPVTINGFTFGGLNPSDFSLIQNNCRPLPFTVSAQSQCTVNVRFTPSAVGVRLGDLQIAHTASNIPLGVPMEGVGEASTVILAFAQTPFPFGAVNLGVADQAHANLLNQGTESAQVSVEIQGTNASDFSAGDGCGSIEPNAVCALPITFTPSGAGVRMATLVATDSVSGQSQTLALAGSGLPSSVPLSAPFPPLFAPTAVGNTTDVKFSFVNNGSSPVTISGVVLTGGDQSDFGILQNDCPAGTAVNANASCFIQLRFNPSASGTRIAGLDVAYQGGSNLLALPLAGAGLSTRSIVFDNGSQTNISSLDFGPQSPGAPVADFVSIANNGTEAVTISSIAIAGTNAGDYLITGNQCPQPPGFLTQYSSCQISLQFTPSGYGPRLARLQVNDDATGNPQSLSLVGFGSSVTPVLRIPVDVLNFVSRPLGSTTKEKVQLYAASTNAVSLSGLTIVGPNASDFSAVNNCPHTLISQSGCQIYVTFTPSATGLRIAELQVQSNAVGSPQLIPLSGLGVTLTPPARAIGLTPVPLAFPLAVGLGYAAAQVVTVTNLGGMDVQLTGFHFAGRNMSDFGVGSNNCPVIPAALQANANCQVTIVFAPTATNLRLATFTVTGKDLSGPPTISLVGEGTEPIKTLGLAPVGINFGTIAVGSTDTGGGTVSITNTGSVPVTFENFKFGGLDPGNFSIQTNFCTNSISPVLAPGATCQVSLNFTPSEPGTRSGELIVTSDASTRPQKVGLTGVGQ